MTDVVLLRHHCGLDGAVASMTGKTSEQIWTSFRIVFYSLPLFVCHESNFFLLAAATQKTYICNTITWCFNRDGLWAHWNMTNVWALTGERWYFPHFTMHISAWHHLKREGTEGDIKVHIFHLSQMRGGELWNKTGLILLKLRIKPRCCRNVWRQYINLWAAIIEPCEKTCW